MPNSPPDNSDDDKPASTYFEWERRSINNPEKKGEGDVSSLPPLPANSPWGSGPAPGREELIDRSEDAATGGPNILEVDQ
jgi:hypothetical protein